MDTTDIGIEKRIIDIVLEIFPTMSVNLTENEQDEFFNLLANIDSIQMLEVMAAIEMEFDIFFDEADLNVDLFKDIKSLSNYVKEKMEQSQDV